MAVTRSKVRAPPNPHIGFSIIFFSVTIIFFSVLSLFDSTTLTLLEFLGAPMLPQPGAVKCPTHARANRDAVMTRAHFASRSWRMAVYKDNDGSDSNSMSGGIREYGVWDSAMSSKVLAALKALGKHSVLLDVGSNAGWYSLLAAYHSHKVWAFEPFADNIGLLRISLCVAPAKVRERVRAYNCALGSGDMDGSMCEVWDSNSTITDTNSMNTICSNKKDSHAVDAANRYRMRKKGFRYVGKSRTRSLDALVRAGTVSIPKNVPVVLKMDGSIVQGWEPMVLAGAASFLKRIRPRVVLAEFAPERIWRAALSAGMSTKQARYSSADFLRFMESHGYNYTLGQGDVQEMVFVRSS